VSQQPAAAYRAPTYRPVPDQVRGPQPGQRVRPGEGLPAWAVARPRPRTTPGRRLGWVWAGVIVGTAAATVVDRVAGGLDGRPALFLLVVLALPFWDGLPARIAPRLLELTAVAFAVAATWLVLAALGPAGWWRGEIAYGLACAIVGTVHALLTRRRTVDP
jgi:hypothetical protein